jgi:hypothetical protein
MQSLDFGHSAFSYYSFAAGVRAFGLRAALNAAVTYGLPLEHALQYVRRYHGIAPGFKRSTSH